MSFLQGCDDSTSGPDPPTTTRPDPNAIVLSIDAELEELAEQSRVLRRQRNAHIPISRLPSELFRNIFFFAIYSNYPSSFLIDDKFDFPTTLRALRQISSVCSHWRTMVIGHSRLWASLSAQCPPWAMECIRRAKGVPLNLSIDSSYILPSKRDSLPKELLDSAPRLRQLILRHSAEFIISILPSLSSHASTLETLKLKNDERAIITMRNIGSRVNAGMFFGFPHLRQMDISGVQLDWAAGVDLPFQATNLTHVQISNTPNILVDSFVDILRLIPALTLLTVRELARISTMAVASLSSPPVDLERLKSISVRSSLERCISFISCLRLSSCNLGSIEVIEESTGDEAPDELLQELLRLCCLTTAPIGNLDIYNRGSLKIGATYWVNHSGQPSPNKTANYNNRVHILLMLSVCRVINIKPIIKRILSHLSISMLNTLTWGIPSRDSDSLIYTLARMAPLVKHIRLVGGLLSFYDKLFLAQTRDPTKPQAKPKVAFFPALAFLEIHQMKVASRCKNKKEDDDTLGEVCRLFQTRAENGARIQCLKIEDCDGVDDKCVDRLEDFVGKVVWDRPVQDLEETDEEE